MKRALLTGITSQDGAYLAEFLLAKGYEVHGIKRRASSLNTARIDHLYAGPHEKQVRFRLHYGDLTDATNLIRIIQEVQPDEIYNLAAQSHVMVSFETPEYTTNSDALGPLRLLEAIRILGLKERPASTRPRLRSSTAKCVKPRRLRPPPSTRARPEACGLFGCNGILFNHESPIRGETFVTRKVSRGLPRIKLILQDRLYVGNLEACHDWAPPGTTCA